MKLLVIRYSSKPTFYLEMFGKTFSHFSPLLFVS